MNAARSHTRLYSSVKVKPLLARAVIHVLFDIFQGVIVRLRLQYTFGSSRIVYSHKIDWFHSNCPRIVHVTSSSAGTVSFNRYLIARIHNSISGWIRESNITSNCSYKLKVFDRCFVFSQERCLPFARMSSIRCSRWLWNRHKWLRCVIDTMPNAEVSPTSGDMDTRIK